MAITKKRKELKKDTKDLKILAKRNGFSFMKTKSV